MSSLLNYIDNESNDSSINESNIIIISESNIIMRNSNIITITESIIIIIIGEPTTGIGNPWRTRRPPWTNGPISAVLSPLAISSGGAGWARWARGARGAGTLSASHGDTGESWPGRRHAIVCLWVT